MAKTNEQIRDDEYVALMRRTNGKASAAMRWEIERRYRERREVQDEELDFQLSRLPKITLTEADYAKGEADAMRHVR